MHDLCLILLQSPLHLLLEFHTAESYTFTKLEHREAMLTYHTGARIEPISHTHT